MKKKVSDFVHSYGGSTSYSGHEKIMYIKSPEGWINTKSFLEFVSECFENLNFKLKEK